MGMSNNHTHAHYIVIMGERFKLLSHQSFDELKKDK